MTSPTRRSRDRSRKRAADAAELEIIAAARRCSLLQAAAEDGDAGAFSDLPLRLTDMALIRRACNADWDVSREKKAAIVRQLLQSLDDGSDRIAVAAAKTVLAMEAYNLRQTFVVQPPG